ncbi:MAG TPA: tryptophan 7-halogenase [Sphingomicrobium sp.]|jgi:tryptophan halogenase|nr:tryptophan 7-halogenase [Sphingomicrobium sp.]
MSGRPRHVTIVGRDAALWLTATAIAKALGPAGVSVTAVELPSQLGPASAYATMPPIETLHAKLGIDEASLLRSTGGSFSLGWNVLAPGLAPFLLAHGSYGAAIDGGDFFSYWTKARRFGLGAAFEDFSPTAMAARHGRILVPDESTELFGRTDYAYHLPAIAYASMLKTNAARLGIRMHQTIGLQVERNGDGSEITAVRLDDGEVVRGDLFVDASGPEGLLIGGSLGVAVEDWRGYFPFNRRLTARANRSGSVPAYSELRLSRDMWASLHATQAATHVVHSFAESGEGGEAVVGRASRLAELSLSDIMITSSQSSIRDKLWAGNCVAIGASACVFDPLFDLDLHAIQLGIVHLLSLFPAARDSDLEAAEYDRVLRSHLERLRDFQSALYVLAGISATVPPSLDHKLATYRARGAIAPMEDETFSTDQWRALFVGLGEIPETWPPAIEITSPDQIKQGFRRILAFVHDKVLEQPTHDHYLADIGARPQ